MNWHIVSYPRSGNHLVRGLIEATSGRPTIGCYGSRRDSPIYQRPSNQATEVITITDTTPIGFKAHTPWEVYQRDREWSGQNGMIFITRDPVVAISSHLVRSRMHKPWLRPRGLKNGRLVIAEMNKYLALVLLFLAYDHGPKLHFRFEDLVAPNAIGAINTDLLTPIGLPHVEEPARLDDIFEMTREAQQTKMKSLTARALDARAELGKYVAQKIEYADVMSMLHKDDVSGER